MGLRVFLFLLGLCFTLVTFGSARATAAADFYPRLLRDGQLRILIAIGQDGAAMDPQFFEDRILACATCGFHSEYELPGMKVFRTEMQFDGRVIPVTLRLIFPVKEMSFRPLKDWFLGALGTDEVVLYAGHSRGGRAFPDFGPIYTGSGQVFFRSPERGWVGLNRGYFARNKFQLFGLNTCQSERYYRDVLREEISGKAASDLGLILTREDAPFLDLAGATIGLVEGLVAQKEPDQLLEAMEQGAPFFHQIQGLAARLYVRDGF